MVSKRARRIGFSLQPWRGVSILRLRQLVDPLATYPLVCLEIRILRCVQRMCRLVCSSVYSMSLTSPVRSFPFWGSCQFVSTEFACLSFDPVGLKRSLLRDGAHLRWICIIKNVD